MSDRLAVRLFRFAARSFPRGLAERHTSEMVADFEAELARRAPNVTLFCLRATLDVAFVGLVERWRRRHRSSDTRRPLSMLGHDLRFGIRTLARSPAFASIAILTLGLGIGANAAIFSVIDAVLLRPLPFREAERVVGISESREAKGWTTVSFTLANFWDLRDRQRSLAAVGGLAFTSFNLTGLDQPVRVRAGQASAGFFDALGVVPVAGRLFRDGDDDPGADRRQVVVGERFWRTRLGADPGAVGSTLTLNGDGYAVIGVAPRGEPFLDWVDLFVPLTRTGDADRGSFELTVVGRLAPGVSIDAARGDLDGVARALAEQYPENKGMGIVIEPSDDWVASDGTRRALWILMGAVGFLLLIACVNLANLFLAKATGRARERSLRAALGASRGRIIKQVLTESILISAFGAAAGLGIAYGIVTVLAGIESGIPRMADVGINGGVLAFTTAVAVATGLLTGVLPAVQANPPDLANSLRDGGRQVGAGRGTGRLRSVLIAAEVAASLALLIGAGLLLRSFSAVMTVDRGFETAGRLVAEVAVPATYDGERTTQFIADLSTRLRASPQVISVAAASGRPLIGVGAGMGFAAADKPDPAEKDIPWASWRLVTAGYFETLGVSLLRGRDFTPQDLLGKPWRVIVSRRIAERLWPGEDPIGRTITLWKGQGGNAAEVIGVSGDMRDWGLTDDPAMTVYLPYYGAATTPIQFLVNGTLTAGAAGGAIRAALAEIDPSLPLSQIESLDQRVSDSVASRRLLMILLSAFAVVALVMALAGVYGVLSFAVSRRTSEIGVRLAMGATTGEVLRLIVRQGMGPVVVGLVIGVAAALGLSRLMTGLLFEIRPTDPTTYLGVAALLAGAALVSCYVPARQALRIDVVAALRKE
jgi:putative ABC transport system permease protein